MPFPNGSSELDTVVLRLPQNGFEVKNWDRYSITAKYLVPCAQFDFSLSGEDLVTAEQLLVPGAPVEISINDRIVMTGAIDKKEISSSRRSGTAIRIIGRDILGPVVSSNVDPKFVFSDSLSVLDVCAAVLNPFGITTVYNDDALNINVMTGATQKPSVTAQTANSKLAKISLNPDGSIATTFSTITVKESGGNTSLASAKLQQLKPHFGEGAYEYMARVISRFGMHPSAAADGSGVVVDEPNFLSSPLQTIKHSQKDKDSNVLESHVSFDLDSQSACIFAQGVQSPLFSDPKQVLQVIMVNEIVGTDTNGNILPIVQDIISRYKSAKVLPLRSELVPARKSMNDQIIARPMFLKDDEARTIDQLELFVRRRMAEHQHKALEAKYTMEGHTQKGIPWTPNTMVKVQDAVSGIDSNLWVMERTFEKSRLGGTVTHLNLVRPFTIELGKARHAGLAGRRNTF